jgi:hypothetical protein
MPRILPNLSWQYLGVHALVQYQSCEILPGLLAEWLPGSRFLWDVSVLLIPTSLIVIAREASIALGL